MNKIPAGYKQTEVGIIPEDWFVKFLGDVLKIRHGKSQKEVVDINGSYPILASGGVIGRANKFIYDKPSVLIGRKGTIDAPQYMETPFWSVDTLFYSEIFDGNHPRFLFYKFLLIDWYAYNEASGVPSLNAKTIERIPVSMPPTKAEQTAIATALNDADALITQLEKLIAKKRLIKQGAMQQLLKPQPGWQSKKLGELAELSPSRNQIKRGDLVTFLGMEDVSEEGRILNQNLMPNCQVKKGLTSFSKNDILVAKITPCFENGKGACLDTLQTENGYGSTEFHVLRTNEHSVPRFVFYHTQSSQFRKQLETEMTGTAGQKRVSSKSILSYTISVPPTITEQTAIAQILSDMDTELDTMEAKLTKYKQIKQGMMQTLLTGRIRLL